MASGSNTVYRRRTVSTHILSYRSHLSVVIQYNWRIYKLSQNRKSEQHRVVPLSIRIIAAFYYIAELAVLLDFISTRLNVSVTLAPKDALTIPLLFIPAITLWSIYRPNPYNRWLPFASIPLIWSIAYFELAVMKLGAYMVQGDDVTDLVVGGWFIVFFLVMLTVAMAIPALLLLLIPTARRFIFSQKLTESHQYSTPISAPGSAPSPDVETDAAG